MDIMYISVMHNRMHISELIQLCLGHLSWREDLIPVNTSNTSNERKGNKQTEIKNQDRKKEGNKGRIIIVIIEYRFSPERRQMFSKYQIQTFVQDPRTAISTSFYLK